MKLDFSHTLNVDEMCTYVKDEIWLECEIFVKEMLMKVYLHIIWNLIEIWNFSKRNVMCHVRPILYHPVPGNVNEMYIHISCNSTWHDQFWFQVTFRHKYLTWKFRFLCSAQSVAGDSSIRQGRVVFVTPRGPVGSGVLARAPTLYNVSFPSHSSLPPQIQYMQYSLYKYYNTDK